MTDVTVS